MMNNHHESFIRYMISRWKQSKGYKPPIEGCTVEEINHMMACQGVTRLPELYLQFMLHMGRASGNLVHTLEGDFRYPMVCDFKKNGRPACTIFDTEIKFPADIFVFNTDRDLYASYFRTVFREDDPIVYRVAEHWHKQVGDKLILEVETYGKLSEYFVNMVEPPIY